MYGKKRLRPASADADELPKRKLHQPSKVLRFDDLWKILPRITQDKMMMSLPIEKKIKYSSVFISITNAQRLKLPIFLADLKRSLEMNTITLHQCFIEIKDFTLIQVCVALTAIINYLHRLNEPASGEAENFLVDSHSLLRGSVLVHKSAKVKQTELASEAVFKRLVKAKPYKCQMANFTTVHHFKEVYFEAESLREWMLGLITSINDWRFRPVKGSVTELLQQSLSRERERMLSSITEIPFLTELFDPESLTNKNKAILVADEGKLEQFMKQLQQYNSAVTVHQSKTSNSTLSAGKNNVQTSSRLKPHPSRVINTSSRFKSGSSDTYKNGERNPYINPVELQDYCVATIKASIKKLTEKSSFQIIKSYVAYPRNDISLVYDNINEIKSKTNCNVVVLNLQTIHESTAWFQNLSIQSDVNPPPGATRVISVGGVGGKCKVALEMILKLLERGHI